MATIRIAIVNGPNLFPETKLGRALAQLGIKLEVTKLKLEHIWKCQLRTKEHKAKAKFRLSREAKDLIHGFNEGQYDYLVVGHCKGMGRKVAERVAPVFRGRILVMHATPLSEKKIARYLKLGVEHFMTDCQAHLWILEQEGATDAPTCT